MNFLPGKKYRVPSYNLVKKNVLCEKGEEITRFDGTYKPLRDEAKFINVQFG